MKKYIISSLVLLLTFFSVVFFQVHAISLPDPILTVNKIVTNDDDGTNVAGDFTLRVDGDQVTNGIPGTTTAGLHIVSEDNLPGYTPSFSGDCDANGNVTMAFGDNKQCTITNNDVDATSTATTTLTVTKRVINDGNGTNQIPDFTLYIDNATTTSGDPFVTSAGQHTVTEAQLPGYTATFDGDCDQNGNVTLADGDQKNCVIINPELGKGIYYQVADRSIRGRRITKF